MTSPHAMTVATSIENVASCTLDNARMHVTASYAPAYHFLTRKDE
jgi:hypothetical protein